MGWNTNTEEGREAKRKYEAEYRLKNKDKIKQHKKTYRDNNKDKIKIGEKTYRENNKDKINQYRKERRKTDSLYRISSNVRSLIRQSFKYKGLKKNTISEKILGCSFSEFKINLETLWSHPNNLDENGNVWMNWDNYGLYKPNTKFYGWDIDHIIPIDSGNTEEEIFKLNHHTNLQPLCSYINRNVKMSNK